MHDDHWRRPEGWRFALLYVAWRLTYLGSNVLGLAAFVALLGVFGVVPGWNPWIAGAVGVLVLAAAIGLLALSERLGPRVVRNPAAAEKWSRMLEKARAEENLFRAGRGGRR